MNQKKIGKFICECRKKKKLTQSELAEKLGVTEKSVSNWENGRNMPDLSLFKSLCDELGISVNELISGEKIKSEKYLDKLDENIINTIDYSSRKVKEKNNLIGIILIVFGILIFVTAMSIFPSESSWGGIYCIFGGIVSLIGISKFTKKLNYVKRLICNFGYFIIFLCLSFVIDYIGVVNMHQPPRFSYSKISYNNMIVYETPFYNVYRINVDTEGEYYIIDKEKKYTKETVPNTPFDRDVSGIEAIYKYRSKNISDVVNVENLVGHLPMAEYGYSVSVNEVDLGLVIDYGSSNEYRGVSKYLERSLLYNALSIFLLIEDVEYIIFNFNDISYRVTRESVKEHYTDFDVIIKKSVDRTKENFNEYVEKRINDYDVVNYYFKVLFIDENLLRTRKIEVLGLKESIVENDDGEEEIIFEDVVKRTITDENVINDIVQILGRSVWLEEGALVTMEGSSDTLVMYDEDGKIYTIYIWEIGMYGLDGKEYSIDSIDREKLNKLLAS